MLLLRDGTGTTTLEFGLAAPTLVAFICAMFGIGLTGFYQGVLDEAVRDTTRQMQINGPAAATEAGFVAAICKTFGVLASDCTASIKYQVQANTVSTGFGGLTPVRITAAGTIGRSFFANGVGYAANANILVQVAYPLPFTLPYVGALITGTGTECILSTAATKAEPFS